MKTRRLSDFVSEQSGKGVKLDRLTPSPTVDVATLRQADLDGNGWLSGAAEMKAAFARADAFDRDGNAQTLVSEDAQGLKTRAGQLLDAVTANAVAGAPTPSPSTGANNRDEAYRTLLARAQAEGSKSDHLAYLDRGIERSPYRANASQVASLFARRPDGVKLVAGNATLATEPFPARGKRPGEVRPLPFLGRSTTQASVAVISDAGGKVNARWYGRNDQQNAAFWSATKMMNVLGVVARLNTLRPDLKVADLSVREAGKPQSAIGLKGLMQDIVSYDAGVPRSNGGAGLFGRLLGNAARTSFVASNSGGAPALQGNYGAGTLFQRPEVVTANGQVVLSGPADPGVAALNRVSASDLTRVHAQAVLHSRLSPEQRIAGAQASSLETVTTAMADDSARYADVALQTLGLSGVVTDVAISSKLGFGFDDATGRYEAAYSGVLQFTDPRQNPPRQRSMSFTLRGEDRDPVALDASFAADMTELVRRLSRDEL
jgi:hypothetical protein